MVPDALPHDVRRLVSRDVKSVAELEALLFLFEHRSRDWSAEEMADVVQTDAAGAERVMFDLMARGLLKATWAPLTRYQFAPTSPELRQTVHRLAELYPTRRLAIIELVAAGPSRSLRLFSDAFRLREEG